MPNRTTLNTARLLLPGLAVLSALILPSFPAAAQQENETVSETVSSTSPVTRIIVEGNDKTMEEVIVQELMIEKGKTFAPQQIEESRQNIMDLGLFKSVEVESEETPEGVEVTFIVREKRFWYFVPVFSRGSDGDITYGVRLQMDNLFGKNNELTVRAKREDLQDTDIQNEQSFELEYDYPRIFGSDYDFGLSLDFEEADIEEERGEIRGDYFRDKKSFGIRLAKWLTTTGPSKGLRVKLGLDTEVFDHEYLRGDPGLFTDLTINTLRPGIEYVDVTDRGTYRVGSNYGLDIGLASSALGSDARYLEYNLYYRRYNSLNPAKKINLNYHLRFGYISKSVFGNATYQVTGGTTVRGFQRDVIEGNSFYIANVEYLRPLFGKETLRGALFLDAGDASRKFSDFGFDDPKFGIGTGLRWKIRSFVRTEIRIDVAHGLGSEGELKIYAGTRATF